MAAVALTRGTRSGGSLDELGIKHGELKDANYGSGVSFEDPDGLPLEFFAPAG